MINGQSTKTMAGKTSGSLNHLCAFSVPYQVSRLFSFTHLASISRHCYSFNSRSHCLPDLEAQTRLRMVTIGGNYG